MYYSLYAAQQAMRTLRQRYPVREPQTLAYYEFLLNYVDDSAFDYLDHHHFENDVACMYNEGFRPDKKFTEALHHVAQQYTQAS